MDKFMCYVRLFLEKTNKKPDADGDGVPDWADKHHGKNDSAEKKTSSKKTNLSKVPPQLRKFVKKKVSEGKVPPQLAPFVKKKKSESDSESTKKKKGKMPPQLAAALKKKSK